MKNYYKIKTTFTVKPDLDSDEILAEFENDEIITEDASDHRALFGEGNRQARAFTEKHGGVIVRRVLCISEFEYYSTNGGNLYTKF